MSFIPLVLACAVCLPGQQSQEPTNVKTDPRFAKAISVQIKNKPIREALAEISKEVGSQASASQAITDLKVSVFADSEPCGTLLDKIANVLGCRWVTSGGQFILSMPPDLVSQRQRYIEAEDEELRAPAEKEATALANAAGSTYDDFVKSVNEQIASGDGQNTVQVATPRPTRGVAASFVDNYAIGEIFRSWSSAQWSAFWSGEVATTLTTVAPTRRPRRPTNPANRQPTEVFARYDAFGSHQLEIVTAIRPSFRPQFELPTMAAPSGKLAQTKFGKSTLEWVNTDEATKSEAFTKPLASDPAKGLDREGTLGDQLEALFKQSGVPIVADAFRIKPPNHGEAPRGDSAIAWLASMAQVDKAFLRVEDGVAMVRHGGFWRLRQYELPEEQTRTLEKLEREPTLSEFAAFFSALTPAQIASLQSEEAPAIATKLEHVKNAIPALRFLGSLGTMPPSGMPVTYESLSGVSQQLFVRAIYDSAFAGGSWLGEGPGADMAKYGFVMSPVDVQDSSGLTTGTSFLFGSTLKDGIDYRTVLRY